MATIELRDLNPAEFNNNLIVHGRLGVGTDSPTAKLHVDNTTGGDDIKFETSTDHDLNFVLEAGTSNNQFSFRIPDEVDRLEFMSDSNIRMTLLDNGNFGIGLTSPGQRFAVKDGNSLIAFAEYNNGANIWLDGSNGDLAGGDYYNILADGTTALRFGYGGVSKITMLADGSLGIGESAPSKKLSVNSGSTGTVAEFKSTGTTAKIQFNNSGGNGCFIGSNNDKLLFQTNSTNRIAITNAGDIGCGTTTPDARIEIVSDGSDDAGAHLRLTHANNNSTDVVSTVNFSNNSGSVAKIVAGTTGANNTGYISFFTDNAGTSSEKMRILADGKIGIGTSAAAANLHVEGGSSQARLIVNSNTQQDNHVAIGYGSVGAEIDNGTFLTHVGSGNTFNIDNGGAPNSIVAIKTRPSSGSSVERLRVDKDGNVGINETTPTEKLHVNGNLKVTGSVKIGTGSQATSISEPGPFDAYTLYEWESKVFRSGNPAYFDTPLCYADADSPWNKSSVATASPISLMSTHGSASINTSGHGKRNYNWDYMIAFNGLDVYDAFASEAPSNYVAIKMPCYYTSGSSDHHVFHLRLRQDRRSGVMLWVCDSSKVPQKKAHGNFNSKRGGNARGSLVGPRNTVSSFNYHGHDWVPFTIRGDYIDTYSFADSDSPTGRSIHFAVTNAVTSESNGTNGQWIAGMAMSRNKKGCMITSGSALYHAVNGSQGRGGNSVFDHGGWYYSNFMYVRHDRVGNCPVPIVGTDKDIIMTFISTGHPDHWGEGTDIYLLDGSGNARYVGANGNNGWDSYVPNQVYRPGLSPIGSFQSLGHRAGFSHFGMIPYTIIIPQTEVARCAYDTEGILCLQIGFSKMHDPWRDGDYRAIATEPAI